MNEEHAGIANGFGKRRLSSLCDHAVIVSEGHQFTYPHSHPTGKPDGLEGGSKAARVCIETS